MAKPHWTLADLPEGFGPCALTIGNFDGVHLGHRRILSVTIERARAEGLQAVALTFDPHPLKLVAPERAPKLLTAPEQRLRRFDELGVDASVTAEFTPELAAFEPSQFVEKILIDKLHVAWVIVGRNFRFGRRSSGDIDTLKELGQKLGFRIEAVEPVRAGGEVVSSTRIRRIIREGRVQAVRRLLGDCFRLEGLVVAGRGVGSKHTAPTLNLRPDTMLLPADGVYVTSTRETSGSRGWTSVTNVGVRPTFGESERTIETYLLDGFDGRTPDRIELTFHRRLRDETRFETAAELSRQIQADAERARRFFRSLEALRGARALS